MRSRAFVLIAGLLVAFGAAAQLPARTTAANGVTVAVTPGNLGAGVKSWDFAVVFDTHSQDLNDDVARNATLVGEKGEPRKPLAWEGAGPGGHHRKGVLKFKPIAPRPQAIELRIARPGEPKPRTFRWDLK